MFIRFLPPASGGRPVAVDFSFVVDDVLEVDEQTSSVTLEFHMSMKWADERLRINPDGFVKSEMTLMPSTA